MNPSCLKGVFLAGVLVLAHLIGCGPVWAYEEGTVLSGGTLTGTVTLEGKVPPSRIFHLVFSPNIDFCQRISDGKGNRYLKEFEVADDGGFKDVVVAVVGVERGKPFDFTPELKLENCEIGPFVTPVRNFHPISMVTKDPVTHDIQAYSIKDPEESYTFQMFNKPMPAGTHASKRVRFRKGHFIFRTQCGIHDFMQSWGIAVGNPYFAVTGEDGRFSIPDLPPGEYDVIAWHPRLQVQVQRVRITPNGKAEIDFAFDGSRVEILDYDLQTGYRLETWLETRQLSPPAVEQQVP